MDAGRALRRARAAADLSQRQLAAAARVPQTTIARIESGVVSPRVDTLDRLLGLCGFRLALSRLGEGVDRSVMRGLVDLTPDELLDLAADEAHAVAELLDPARR